MNVAATWETLLHLQRDGFPFNARMLFASRFKSEPVSFSRLELWYIPLDYSATHWSLFMLCLKALIWMKWPFRSRGRRVNRHLKAEDGRPLPLLLNALPRVQTSFCISASKHLSLTSCRRLLVRKSDFSQSGVLIWTRSLMETNEAFLPVASCRQFDLQSFFTFVAKKIH